VGTNGILECKSVEKGTPIPSTISLPRFNTAAIKSSTPACTMLSAFVSDNDSAINASAPKVKVPSAFDGIYGGNGWNGKGKIRRWCGAVSGAVNRNIAAKCEGT
jgi:hypothetical protein